MIETYPFVLPGIPFDLNRLAPNLNPRSVRNHYYNIYGNYFKRLNEMISAYENLYCLKDKTIKEILTVPWEIPTEHRTDVMHLAGGIYNHYVYFKCIGRTGDALPTAKVRCWLNEHFGSVENFKNTFLQAAKKVNGSGWVWLVKTHDGRAAIALSRNHETPLTHGVMPILCCDVWEHAYFCNFNTEREKYIRSFFGVVNWKAVEANLMG